MKIISLDLGTKTGYATGINGEIKTHGFKFWSNDRHFDNQSFVNFRKWLIPGVKNVHRIVCEKPNMGMPGFDATRVLFGMYGIVQEVCGMFNVDLVPVSASGIKLFWTGDGRADKNKMVFQAQMKGYKEVMDHNEADAIAAYHYYYDKLRVEGTIYDLENDLSK